MNIERLQSEMEIRNLISQLAHLADDGELETYIECFTETASWGGGGQPVLNGREDILKGARGRRESGVTGPGSGARHVVTTSYVQVLGDRATAKSVFHFYTDLDSQPQLRAMGVYLDEFRLEDQRWRLHVRQLQGSATTLK
jgi:uncharacterized protein (TIGR02246 family)